MAGRDREYCRYIRDNAKNIYYLAFSVLLRENLAVKVMTDTVKWGQKRIRSPKNPEDFRIWILKHVFEEAEKVAQFSADCGKDMKLQIFCSRYPMLGRILHMKQEIRPAAYLHYYVNLTDSQIAAVTGKTEASVLQTVAAARQELMDKTA